MIMGSIENRSTAPCDHLGSAVMEQRWAVTDGPTWSMTEYRHKRGLYNADRVSVTIQFKVEAIRTQALWDWDSDRWLVRAWVSGRVLLKTTGQLGYKRVERRMARAEWTDLEWPGMTAIREAAVPGWRPTTDLPVTFATHLLEDE